MERIGRYRILGEAGRGAMGVVYRAADSAIGREVAIKTIRLDASDASAREKLRERLFREARSAGVLSHPNIVTIYDMGETEVEAYGSLAWVAMGLVRGPSLESLLAMPEPLPNQRMFSILRQTAVALDYAHSRGVIHRDIKPANVMTDEDGSVKITDFGIARFIAAERLSETRTVTGTPNYMSPEQIQGMDLDGRTDQFSLGVLAWEILTGERPFRGDNLSTVVYRIVSDEPEASHHLNGTLTPRIDEVLRRALAKDPAARFATCSSFIGSLETACADSPGWRTMTAGTSESLPTAAVDWIAPDRPAIRPSPKSRLPPPAPARKRAGWILPAIAGVALAAAAGAFLVFSGWPEVAGKSEKVSLSHPIAVAKALPTVAEPAPETPIVESPLSAEIAREPDRPVPTDDATTAVPPPEHAGRLQDIWTESNPPGAVVVLDKNEALSCVAPCVLHARPGIHQVLFSMEGYRRERREIRIQNATVEIPPVNLQQIMSSLLISSTPAGAAVRLNGTPIVEKTPIALHLKPGNYIVTVEKDGESRTERVQLGESPRLVKVQFDR